MKKLASLLCAVILFAGVAYADEGMWLLPLLEKMNGGALSDLGCRITPEQIYNVNKACLKDAVVQFGGGCTGEIISDEGLLVTNHHCGYSSIQALSSTEHNYLEDGFWAMGRDEEIPVPGLSVKILQSMTDVTKIIAKAGKSGDEDALMKAIVDIQRNAMEDTPGCIADVESFFNDNNYYLIVYKVYNDIRFVGAPPASAGKFGGDTDNWMWPRHTCDFSMFRIYAGKDNQPAEYSPDNVPMVPRQSLKISLKGVQDRDFAMIMGYPGRTQRFQTSAQLERMLALNDIRIAARTVRQDVLWKEMRADGKVGLQYASKYSKSSNGWKKWIGMKEAFGKLGIIERQKAEEEEFARWAASNKKRSEKYGSALSTIAENTQAGRAAMESYTLISESLLKIELLNMSSTRNNSDYKDYDVNVDRKVASAMARFYLENVKPEDRIDADLSEEALDRLFAESDLTSALKKDKALAEGKDLSKDPAIALRSKVLAKYKEAYAGVALYSAGLKEASKAYTAGQLEWKAGKPSYPDANSTPRLTYGQVLSYEPKDGVIFRHYTTLKGVMEKEDPDNYEFRVPERLKEIYRTKDYGQYANADGELVTCFLTNCDITGGNSGSPVLDADGNLIGLAFDGNWEAMSSDVMFEPELQRCICVDIRYVLLMMDKFGGAGYLLDELKLVR